MKKIFTSRTNWTIAIMFIVGGVEAISTFIPDGALTLILGILGTLAMVFKMNPSQTYGE